MSDTGELCLQHGQKFLLIGDSITDCGRRDSAAPFGAGYVALLRDLVLARWPERDITWVNKGIGGNRITDLQERWEDDVIREAPDWLSVKIGINDLHTHLGDPQHGVSPARFRAGYHDILSRTKGKLDARTEARPDDGGLPYERLGCGVARHAVRSLRVAVLPPSPGDSQKL